MGARQPVAQVPGGFGRGRAVEGHQGARDSGKPHELGAPACFGDRRDLNEILASADVFLKPMDVHDEKSGAQSVRIGRADSTRARRGVKRRNIRRRTELLQP